MSTLSFSDYVSGLVDEIDEFREDDVYKSSVTVEEDEALVNIYEQLVNLM